MILNDNNKDYKIQIYTSALMIIIASADENIEKEEIETIKEVISDFYNLNMEVVKKIIQDAQTVIDDSVDIYHIASFLNENLSKQDRIDLIYCIFEVAYSDNNLHFMEKHLIDKISNIFNLNKTQILNAKKEIQKYLQ
tara:strand:- start:391 stop:804 length:414 start_codon:yes stop_codon:yes gene_type:complete